MQESQVNIKYLKVDKNTHWLSYQRRLPKELLGKAKQLGLKGMLVRPLGLTSGASTAKITAAKEAQHLAGLLRLSRSVTAVACASQRVPRD